MLAAISTKILGVSAQIGLAATSPIGAGSTGVASANWQISSPQRNSRQARIQRLYTDLSIRTMFFQGGSSAQKSQGGNRSAQNIQMHDAKRENRDL